MTVPPSLRLSGPEPTTTRKDAKAGRAETNPAFLSSNPKIFRGQTSER